MRDHDRRAMNREPWVAANVTTYPPDDTDRSSAAVREFRDAARARLVPGMALGLGVDDVSAGTTAPLVSFAFGPELIPLPMEEIIDWLRTHPLVRVLEVERYSGR